LNLRTSSQRLVGVPSVERSSAAVHHLARRSHASLDPALAIDLEAIIRSIRLPAPAVVDSRRSSVVNELDFLLALERVGGLLLNG
jgi:hypothetical protein